MTMIEIWLSSSTDKLRLPVLPAEVAAAYAGGAQRSTLQDLGEVILSGKRKLKTLQIDSYFPARYDGNCQYLAIPSPGTAAQLLQGWIDEGTPVRMMITGGAMDINMQVLVEGGTFVMGKGPGDIEYSIALTEYRPIAVKKLQEV
jgi:hypothetical protein